MTAPDTKREIAEFAHSLVLKGISRARVADLLVEVGLDLIERSSLDQGVAVQRFGAVAHDMAKRTDRLAREVRMITRARR